MLTTKRSGGVTPGTLGINHAQATKHTSEGIYPDFETQGHQKFETGIQVAIPISWWGWVTNVLRLQIYEGMRNG